jgi:hypothetical protein
MDKAMSLTQFMDMWGLVTENTATLKEMAQGDLEVGNITSQDYQQIIDTLDWLID